MGQITFGASAMPGRGRRQQWYTVPVSIAVHTVVLGAIVVVPLVATGALPTPQSVITFVGQLDPPPPPPAPRVEAPPVVVDSSVNVDAAPAFAPEGIAPEPLQGVVNLGSAVPFTASAQLAPMPVYPDLQPAYVPEVPRRVGGDIKEPRKLRDVRPVYPALARAARAQGVVILEATIAKDGTVKDATVLRSHPLLDAAALIAVREWRYSPSLLNGVPVEVLMTVTVHFQLQ